MSGNHAECHKPFIFDHYISVLPRNIVQYLKCTRYLILSMGIDCGSPHRCHDSWLGVSEDRAVPVIWHIIQISPRGIHGLTKKVE